MSFNTSGDDLRRTVKEAQGPLQSLSEQETSAHPQPGKWSKKEILGHLIDSATNNHQRFVRAALYGPLTFPGFEHEALAKLQRCNDVERPLLVRLWWSYKLFLVLVFAGVLEVAAHSTSTVGHRPTSPSSS